MMKERSTHKLPIKAIQRSPVLFNQNSLPDALFNIICPYIQKYV
jgi:hypothetical protein